MPLRGGPPPELGLGGVGQQAAPQVPGLLQMAQSAMDGSGARRDDGSLISTCSPLRKPGRPSLKVTNRSSNSAGTTTT